MRRMLVPDMWANRGRYRTRPDGSLFPREQRRLREMMSRQDRIKGAGEPAPQLGPPEKAEETAICGFGPAGTAADGIGPEKGGE